MTGRQGELDQREKRRRAAQLELKAILELDQTDPIGETAGLSIDELLAQIPARLISHELLQDRLLKTMPVSLMKKILPKDRFRRRWIREISRSTSAITGSVCTSSD